MSEYRESKILEKTYDMIQYGYICLRQYDKSERHTLAAETKRSMYDLLSFTIRADKRYYKKTTLQDLDIELENLRYLIRLGKDLGFLAIKKYEVWAKLLEEVGRMLGGWIKSTAALKK